jgi:hypothetical protein
MVSWLKLPRGTTSGNGRGSKRLRQGMNSDFATTGSPRDALLPWRDGPGDLSPADLVSHETGGNALQHSPFDLVGSFSSLEELYELLEGPLPPDLPHGGSVRLHPCVLPEQDLGAVLATRKHLDQLGLRLIVTPAVSANTVELRRHTRPALRKPA